MFKFILRVAMFLAGFVLLADIVLPTSTQSLQVDQHTIRTDRGSSNGMRHTWTDTSYTLHLVGGHLSSCSVGYSAYWRLKDGDAVVVQATRLLKNCIRITRGEELIEADTRWKIFKLISGLLLLAVAAGWINMDEDDFRFWRRYQ